MKFPKFLQPKPPKRMIFEDAKRHAAVHEMTSGRVRIPGLVRLFEGDEARHINPDFEPWLTVQCEDKTLLFGMSHYEHSEGQTLSLARKKDTDRGVVVCVWTCEGPYPDKENQQAVTINASPQYLRSEEAIPVVKDLIANFMGFGPANVRVQMEGQE